MRRLIYFCLLVLAVPGAIGCSAQAGAYQLKFSAVVEAGQDAAVVTIQVDQSTRALRSMDFDAPRTRYQLLNHDGEIQVSAERIDWQPPAGGGRLRLAVGIASKRGDALDATLQDDWLVARLGDLFPAARVRVCKGAQPQPSTLSLQGPRGWSFETRYGAVDKTAVTLPDEGRLYTRPTGWLLAGDLGIRRARIAGTRVAVSAPTSSGARRLDTLTFLHWTLPTLREVLPDFPARLLIVSAPDPMWRGGLSAPDSFYMHVERPLVSENATSTLLHELLHVGGLHSAAQGADWIVEGLAEFYSLDILRRSGGISERRFQRALEDWREWVEADDGKLSDPSKGADTAAAALYFYDLAQRLGPKGLDALTRQLVAADTIDVQTLEALIVTGVSDAQTDSPKAD